MSAEHLKISDFDAAEYLRDEESIAAFLNESAESGDPAVLLNALSTVARARSMTELAQASGLGRESLYKALKPGAQPRYETVMKVINALGVQIVFTHASARKSKPSRVRVSAPGAKSRNRERHATEARATAQAKRSSPIARGKMK